MTYLSASTKAQFANYLNWISERGLTFPVVRSSPAEAHQKAKPDESGQTSRPPYSHQRLLIVSNPLSASELELMEKIIGAIEIDRDSILWLHALVDYRETFSKIPFVIILGPQGSSLWDEISKGPQPILNKLDISTAESPITLLISHPGAMLANPLLKRDVWEALKSFKIAIHQKGSTFQEG